MSPRERGQASVELIAGVPAVILVAALALQLLAAGHTLSLADGAAESAALAQAADRPVRPAVRSALPRWARERVHVERSDGGRIEVRLRPPSPLAAVASALEVSSSAWARSPRERP